MTNLKTANIGMNKYCGPAVLSILTGKSTDECAQVISKINGQYNVAGVQLSDLLKAADKLGFASQKSIEIGSLYRTFTNLVKHDGMYIVAIINHFVCIEVQDKKIYFCDNHTKEPIPAASSARLSQPVLAIYRVWKKPDFVEEKPKPVVYEPSAEYLQIVHLVHMVRHHKKNCNDIDCGTSLTVMKQIADRLLIFLLGNERTECENLIKETEWF